ncbi:MAG: AtpZ/AtpI family protein [Flavobacteriales bacterium]|jgi:F0F1-type ATP synthase assembly protein I|nr:MAG: AtpZ/AtpI family protein [Flavobacteriales bacterium]MBE7441272.1 AtpZ/AtpI family protein [Flavobacteriales bacterium]MBX2960237.1 AtpZ/AtpI family protein [Flavobacteriales bacterium]HRN40481.1 AtpZ/AtpI family protein [Vicingus sp.]
MKKNEKPSKKPNSSLNQYARFSGIAIQMGVIIGFSAWGGRKLDQQFNLNKPYLTIVCSLLGVAFALYLIIREVINMGKNDE